MNTKKQLIEDIIKSLYERDNKITGYKYDIPNLNKTLEKFTYKELKEFLIIVESDIEIYCDECVGCLFDWRNTPQGWDYWHDIQQRIRS